MEISTNQNAAVNDLVAMIAGIFKNESGEIDTIEAISGTARLAGSFLFRSFGFTLDDAKPGSVVLSEEANTKGPQLVNITYSVLQHFGVVIDNDKMSTETQQQSASNFVDMMNRIQKAALEIMQKNELNYEQMAQSAAIATAFIIQQSDTISPEDGFGTAIYHYVEGIKTYPPEFD